MPDEKLSKKRKAYYKKWKQENKDKVQQYYKDNAKKIYEYQKKWRQENKDKVNAIQRRYYKNNKEKILQKEWYLKTKEQIKEKRIKDPETREKYLTYQKEYARINAEKRNAAAKQWRIDNPEKYRQQLEWQKIKSTGITLKEYKQQLEKEKSDRIAKALRNKYKK